MNRGESAGHPLPLLRSGSIIPPCLGMGGCPGYPAPLFAGRDPFPGFEESNDVLSPPEPGSGIIMQ